MLKSPYILKMNKDKNIFLYKTMFCVTMNLNEGMNRNFFVSKQLGRQNMFSFSLIKVNRVRNEISFVFAAEKTE